MSGQEAKYQQVIDWVKENIENGSLRGGDRLMSENEMSERFGLSRQTIRRATGELVSQNLLTRRKGSGTYIAGTDADSQPRQRGDAFSSSAEEGKKRHHNIAVISTFNESYIFPAILKGIEGVLTDHGYTMQVMFTDNRLYRERSILKLLLEKNRIDGLIVEPVKSALPNPNLPLYRELISRGIPLLFFNAFYPELDAPCVRIDDILAAEIAVKMLLDAGHTQIGAIFKADDGQGRLRYQGFLKAMMDSDLELDQNNIIWLDTPATFQMSDIADCLFRRLEKCTGVVCYNDQIAYHLIELALERGIRVPEDLSVTGIDDSYLAGVCKVPFSSVAHPKEDLGRKAAENLIRMIDDPGFDGNALMDISAVRRQSVSAPAAL